MDLWPCQGEHRPDPLSRPCPPYLLASMQYHPETSQQLAWGSPSAYSSMSAADDSSPLGVRNYGIKTQVEVREDENGLTSKLLVNTVDRPGLLTGERLSGGFQPEAGKDWELAARW